MTPEELKHRVEEEIKVINICEKMTAPLRKRAVLAESVVQAVLEEVDWTLHPKVKKAVEEWQNETKVILASLNREFKR